MQVEHSPLHQLLTKIIATKQASHYDVGATSPHIMSFQSQGLCSVSGFCVWNISLVPPFYISPLHPWNITLAPVQTFVGISYQHHIRLWFKLVFHFWHKTKNARKSTRRCASKTWKDCRDWWNCSYCLYCSFCSMLIKASKVIDKNIKVEQKN